ncbi:MAG: iron-sulfur cluster repair di-iron protein [Acidobacteria bacterium]|uniref:Iron-sulfur cluster repair di-iron protein n=1 Tax=Candidatus Polarisedimenticola svalbardensis TaxID=2886004 RepID=A0A8J6XTR6_9BACT|nr:iron-sulfur cluster repair di-iron protein [Candidatus Polarisedimenticola svalbardensis]
MTMDTLTTVGEIATEHPLATRVFARHGIDFCCGGGVSLKEACETRGLDLDLVLAEIEKETGEGPNDTRRWDQEPLTDLIDHILVTYHRPLDEELPRLHDMAVKVLDVHRDKAEQTLTDLLATYQALKAELEQHMAKEEQILFPMIRQGRGAMAGGPIHVMEAEHESAGAALARLRSLTNDYQVPEEACNTWRALWHGLQALEHELHSHIHLENNILFPRAQTESV